MKIPLELNIVQNEQGEETIFLNFWNAINGDDVTGEVYEQSETPILHGDMVITLNDFIDKVKQSFKNAKKDL